jgi:heme ABC exporter ATP-binding subunit CcmA
VRLTPVKHLIALDGIGVDRGGSPILRGVDLNLTPTQVVGVVGPNGSGKTTLLRLIATLLTPSSGQGHVLGAKLGSPSVHEVRSQIGMISHIPAVIPELSQRENLVHFARLSGQAEERVEGVLRVVGLDEAAERKAEASSFGMLRRIEVARLLLTNPSVLLLDEAFGGLDSEAQELIAALIQRTTSRDGVVVVVSHDSAHLAKHTSEILRIRSGRLEEVV